jgi:hypothetical protein
MRQIVLSVAAIAAGAAGGCSTTGPARSMADLVARDRLADQSFPQPFDPVVSVTEEAMADLGVRDVGVRLESELAARGRPVAGKPQDATLSGRGADGRPVTVTVRSRGNGSVVSVRVGRFGDEALCRALLDRIGVRLGTLPPAPIPAEAPSTPGSQPFFSRAAVPDAVMLRDQAEAGYRDSPAP